MTAIVKPEIPVYETAPDDLKPILQNLAEVLADEPDWTVRKDSLLEVLAAIDGMTALSPAQQSALASVMEQVENGTMDEAEAERALSAIAADDPDDEDADGEATPPPDLLPMFIGAILERLDEASIHCAEQAGFYLLSVQPEHVEAAEAWLEETPENAEALRSLLDGDPTYATLFDLLLGSPDEDDGDEDDGLPEPANDDEPGGEPKR